MVGEKDKLDIATELVHTGERGAPPEGKPTATPIYASATYTYDSMEEIDKVFAGEKAGYIYTRYGNPTVTALETALRTVEGGATACGYSSGMATLHAALFACELTPGATVLASQDLYGATTSLLQTIFGALGIKTVTADFSDLDLLREKAGEVRPRVMIAETISNPLLKVCDIDACAEIGREASISQTFSSGLEIVSAISTRGRTSPAFSRSRARSLKSVVTVLIPSDPKIVCSKLVVAP